MNAEEVTPPCIYCAGPLFNRSERAEMESIADRLIDAGYRVYLPHRDGMEFRLVLEVLVARGWERPVAAKFLHQAIFALDVYQLVVECDAVVWNQNGRTPDEGAVSEAAMAWTLGKPIVAYSDDVRTLIAGRINPLLAGLVEFDAHDDLEAAVQALGRAIEQHDLSNGHPRKLEPRVRQAADDGRKLWQAMLEGSQESPAQTLRSGSGQDHRPGDLAREDDAELQNRLADVVEELFAPTDAQRTERVAAIRGR